MIEHSPGVSKDDRIVVKTVDMSSAYGGQCRQRNWARIYSSHHISSIIPLLAEFAENPPEKQNPLKFQGF
jgi:hypothetical protein